MAGKFNWRSFSNIDINDEFFDSLKSDYPKFIDWFNRKKEENANALVYYDDKGIGALLYLKSENINGDNSPITVDNKNLPKIPRIKIGTLKLSERVRKQRLGEGAIGVALWYWQNSQYDEIYVTIFEKHQELINLLIRFGFICIGKNDNQECVFIKNRCNLDYSTPYKCFPFIKPSVKAGIIAINDDYHDKLFPYSELARNNREVVEKTAGNGITKVFLASPYSKLEYTVGMPVFIFRVFTGEGRKSYNSVVTSYCTISNITPIKSFWKQEMSLEDFLHLAGNKSVYSKKELIELYNNKKFLVAIELIYNGYFGKGHNVIYKRLKDAGLFEGYPYTIKYNYFEFTKILEMGGADVQNIIIN